MLTILGIGIFIEMVTILVLWIVTILGMVTILEMLTMRRDGDHHKGW